MIPWISLFLTIAMLTKCESTSCEASEYPRYDYATTSCRPDESLADKASCKANIFVKNSEDGKIEVKFNILSKFCNVSKYTFEFEVDKSMTEKNCSDINYNGDKHSQDKVVQVTHDETVQSCGKIQTVTFEKVYKGCYRLTCKQTWLNETELGLDLKPQYLKTSYEREMAPCNKISITPYNIERNDVKLSMTNVFKLGTIFATVTRPEGNFICNHTTGGLQKFLWEMTHDETHNIDCTIHNLVPGNYCLYVFIDHVCCSTINDSCGLRQNFTIYTKYDDNDNNDREPPGSYTIHVLVIVFLCLVVICFIILILIWQRKRRIFIRRDFYEEVQRSFSQRSSILLLYCHDCEQFMEMMITFREMLKEITKCKVYDCFDPVLCEEVGQNKFDWVRSHVSSDDMKIVVVESSCAILHQQALIHHNKVGYTEPTWLDELFLFGLKTLIDDIQRNIYQDIFVMRINGFTEESEFLNYLAPYKRYVVPQHLEILLDDLSPQINLSPCLDNSQDVQKFQQHLKNLVSYKRQNPGYLDEFVSRV